MTRILEGAFERSCIPSHQLMIVSTRVSSPANAEAAQLFRDNMKEYIRRVRVSRPSFFSPL